MKFILNTGLIACAIALSGCQFSSESAGTFTQSNGTQETATLSAFAKNPRRYCGKISLKSASGFLAETGFSATRYPERGGVILFNTDGDSCASESKFIFQGSIKTVLLHSMQVNRLQPCNWNQGRWPYPSPRPGPIGYGYQNVIYQVDTKKEIIESMVSDRSEQKNLGLYLGETKPYTTETMIHYGPCY